jgi:hypothetical protein
MTSRLCSTRVMWFTAITVLTAGCASAGAQKTAASVSDALANLHRTQAKAADWEGPRAGAAARELHCRKSWAID